MATNNTEIVLNSAKQDTVVIKSNTSLGDSESEHPVLNFFDAISDLGHFDTGLMPLDGTGMLSIRKALDWMQIVYQYKPEIYPIAWASYEGGSPTIYHLAQPYRIVVLEYHNGNLNGGRQFYSPTNITNLKQSLYHVNLPNINCRGYGTNNGVGWTCIYHKDDISNQPLGEKIRYGLKRISGEETYNDANMSGTDGTRFYQEFSKHKFLSDPEAWQEKSKKEGYQWTLNDDLWLPILVAGPDEQRRHEPKGQPLTVEWMMYGHWSNYYHDLEEGHQGLGYDKKARRKPYNLLIRSDESDEVVAKKLYNMLKSAIGKKKTHTKRTLSANSGAVNFASQFEIKPTFPKTCGTCKVKYVTDDNSTVADADKLYWSSSDISHDKKYSFVTKGGKTVCSPCGEKFFECAFCSNAQFSSSFGIMPHIDQEHAGSKACYSCYQTYVNHIYNCNCGAQYISNPQSEQYVNVLKKWSELNVFDESYEEMLVSKNVVSVNGTSVCHKCADIFNCDFCSKAATEKYTINATEMQLVDAQAPEMHLCADCFMGHQVCACNKLKACEFIVTLGDGTPACQGCIGHMSDGMPIYDPNGEFQDVVIDMDNVSVTPVTINPDVVLEMP